MSMRHPITGNKMKGNRKQPMSSCLPHMYTHTHTSQTHSTLTHILMNILKEWQIKIMRQTNLTNRYL